MSKKGAVVAIVVVLVLAGAVAAYSSNVLSPKAPPSSESQGTATDSSNNKPTNIQSVNITKENKVNSTSTTSSLPPTVSNSISNSTIIANNTIIINKPVYNNNNIFYQPVNININQYNTIIKQTFKISDNDKVVINNEGDVIVNNVKKVPSPSASSTSTYTLTIRAARLPSDGWSGKFTDDHTGMFVSVYDLSGKQIKTGFADENGLKVTGLKNRLYFVYPADCNDCAGTKNDIMFQKWEDGSKDRPRLIPAGSDITASYTIKTPAPKPAQEPVTITLQNMPSTAKVGTIINFTGIVKSNVKDVAIAQGDTVQLWEADNVAMPTNQEDRPIKEFTVNSDGTFAGSWLVQALDGTGCKSTEPNCEAVQKDDMSTLELYFVYVNHQIAKQDSGLTPTDNSAGTDLAGYYWSEIHKLGIEDISKALPVSAGIVKFNPNPAILGDTVEITGYVASPAFNPEGGKIIVYGSTIHNSNGTIAYTVVKNVKTISAEGGGLVYQGEFSTQFDVTSFDNDATKDIFELKANYVPSAYEPNVVTSNLKPPATLKVITEDEIPKQPELPANVQNESQVQQNNVTSQASSTNVPVSITLGASSKTTSAFSPNPIEIKVSDTVTWTNNDTQPHTVTSGINATADGNFDSSPNLTSLLTPGHNFSHTFFDTGEYRYFCAIHPNMVGTVLVR